MTYDENTSKVKGVNTNWDCLRAIGVSSSSIHDDYETNYEGGLVRNAHWEAGTSFSF